MHIGSYGGWYKLSYISLHKLWLRKSVRSCNNQSGLLIITHGNRQFFQTTPPTKRNQIINTAYGKVNQLLFELKISLCDSLKQICVTETNSCINVFLQPAFAVRIAREWADKKCSQLWRMIQWTEWKTRKLKFYLRTVPFQINIISASYLKQKINYANFIITDKMCILN